LDTTQYLVALPALALVLALAAGGGKLVRMLRGGPVIAGGHRVRVVERLALDTRRQVQLIRCGDAEFLVLTGGPVDVLLGTWRHDGGGPA
jgi:flagellar biogenesis protein FliO